MYVSGLVVPVPADKMDAYRQWAENGAKIFRDYGCLEIVESWEDFVPDGKETDFRRAVAAKEGEKIVFTWQVWPDKASFYAAEARMHEDARLDAAGEPPLRRPPPHPRLLPADLRDGKKLRVNSPLALAYPLNFLVAGRQSRRPMVEL